MLFRVASAAINLLMLVGYAMHVVRTPDYDRLETAGALGAAIFTAIVGTIGAFRL